MSSPQSLMLLEKAMEIFRALKEWPFDLLVASQDSACKWNYEVTAVIATLGDIHMAFS